MYSLVVYDKQEFRKITSKITAFSVLCGVYLFLTLSHLSNAECVESQSTSGLTNDWWMSYVGWFIRLLASKCPPFVWHLKNIICDMIYNFRWNELKLNNKHEMYAVRLPSNHHRWCHRLPLFVSHHLFIRPSKWEQQQRQNDGRTEMMTIIWKSLHFYVVTSQIFAHLRFARSTLTEFNSYLIVVCASTSTPIISLSLSLNHFIFVISLIQCLYHQLASTWSIQPDVHCQTIRRVCVFVYMWRYRKMSAAFVPEWMLFAHWLLQLLPCSYLRVYRWVRMCLARKRDKKKRE